MRMIARLLTAAVLVLMWPGVAHADGEPGTKLTVTNDTAAACGLSTVAEGTVQVLSVRRDGQELAPLLGRSFYLDGIINDIAAGTKKVEPKSSVDVALIPVRVGEGDEPGSVVLRSVTAMPDGGGMDALWPVGAKGAYEVTAAYVMPDMEGACQGVLGSQTIKFTVGDVAVFKSQTVWILAGAGLVVIIVIVAVLLLIRRRKAPAALALIALSITLIGVPSKPARADVKVDPTSGVPVPGVDFQKAVDGCMAGFAAPGGDPSGILSRLKDPKTPQVRIIPTTGGSGAFETPEGPGGKGSSTVTWNPTSTDDYGDGVLRDPCAALYHELNHADDISKDQVPQGDCGDTGIKTAEVKATMAENKYRVAKGLPPRTEYQGKKLPKSLDDCKKPKKKDPPKKGPVKLCEGTVGQSCATSNGDPHLVTFDRAYYDFQAVGEFVLAKSTSGAALEVQTRQAAMGGSRTVSVNSAVAFRLGDHKVALTIVNGGTQVHLDGQVTPLSDGDKALPGGGKLTRRESDIGGRDGYDVEWPDGSGAAVDQIGSYGYRLLLKLSPSRSGKMQGLLGNFDSDPANDIAPAGGSPLVQPVAFDKLYPSYADSWRIKQSDSLFTYASGQSTETFTDRAYPAKPVTINDIEAARRAQAEAICRWAGITSTWQFLECVFDVALSGRPEFAVGTAATELIARQLAEHIAATPLVSGTLTPGGKLTFTGKAGQAVFVDAVSVTLRDDCSPYKLLDPEGKQLNSGCHINGVGYVDRTELKVDGQYTVLLTPREGSTGQAHVNVYVAKDTNAAITPNGAEMTATLEQPGSRARYTFAGIAGQRVFFEVSQSTLPDQCSLLELADAAGKQLNSGCVINGYGDIEGTILPANGTYTVTVDPRERALGSVHLQLFMAADVVGTIATNGTPVTATISQPGLVVLYRFTGTPGMSLVLKATDATLPDQCSPLRLLDPAGKQIGSGCVINGTGDIRPVTLDAAGTYTVVVDPSSAATGSVKLTLNQGS